MHRPFMYSAFFAIEALRGPCVGMGVVCLISFLSILYSDRAKESHVSTRISTGFSVFASISFSLILILYSFDGARVS